MGRFRVALLTALVLVVCAGALVGVIALANAVDLYRGATSPVGSSYYSLGISLFAGIGFVALFTTVVAIYFGDPAIRRRTPLYLPLVAMFGAFAMLTGLVAASATDLIAHHLRARWTYLADPEARFVSPTLYLVAFACAAAFVGAMLRLSGWSRNLVLALYGGIVGITALGVGIILLLGRFGLI
jgi:hypothetical protein